MDDLFLELQAALAGEYSLERELGRGGMGVVYLAREVRLAREVALKVLPPSLAASPVMRARFLREAQTAAGLSHPNIVPIHRVDETTDFVYFVMAYVNGETLAERVRHRGPLAPHQAARMLREVAWALTYAHGNGIIHRDIKPENILLERGTDRALVTDFGIAGIMQTDARDADGAIAGTPHYASPEQIAGQPLGAASDLYSLGVTAFFALTGRLPFDAPTTREVVALHLNGVAPSVGSYAPTTPLKLSQIVERCLAKRSEHRYANAAAFVEAIEQAVEPPRELPTAIRLWLKQTNQLNHPTSEAVAATIFASLWFMPALRLGAAWPVLAVGIPGALLIGTVPSLLRMQRLLAAGYGIDDIREGLRDYWRRRREEELFEMSSPAHSLGRNAVKWICGTSAAVAVGATIAASSSLASVPVQVLSFCSIAFAVGANVLALRDWTRLRSLHKRGESQMKFYEGKWAERFIRLAGFGIKKRAPAESLPQLTEVALGRATDALFDSLPKDVRKQLKQLPGTVKQLEAAARTLRAELDRIDGVLAQLDDDARRASDASAWSDDDAERSALRSELATLRERAADRLGATVAALENIRLDLLRLQLGDARPESVTTTLDVARNVAAELHNYVAAKRDVERLLEDHTTPVGG